MEQNITYVGEHLWAGQVGQAAVVLGFVASLVAMVAYGFATQRRTTPEASGWLRIGRWAFGAHALGMLGAIGLLFYMMSMQWFEYRYVWEHVSESLPYRYILSAFWEGQEGSFFLWLFWHIVLGGVLMWRAGKWEAPVLATVSLVQVLIGSMVLGTYVFGYKIGSSPFLLLRDTMEAPIFARPDYVTMLDGQGLNLLLQNYWNTIHPPVLFLGFASVLIPFAYAVAGLWTREHRAWLKPGLQWALFSGAAFGLGILMGGAWAYEALTFGGYWAWDPVENSSLVPWLVLVAGIHTNLIANATGRSIKSTYGFYLAAFAFVVYSTTLTRSGILGDTSVHAFTEMGLESQLAIFLGTTILLALGLYFARQGSIPTLQKEEAGMSREFWMFMGAMVLLFSSVLITFTTSIPVWNEFAKLFDPEYQELAPPEDPVDHHNRYQLWIGIGIVLLSSLSQWLRFREPGFKGRVAKRFYTRSGVAATAATVGMIPAFYLLDLYAWQHYALTWAAIFGVIANGWYLVDILPNNKKMVGSALAHLGFAVMLLGILASGLNQSHFSNNVLVQKGLFEDLPPDERDNYVMLIQGQPLYMNGYEVTYMGDTVKDHVREFEVNFKELDERGRSVGREFNLYPNAMYNLNEGKVEAYNPDTRHRVSHDIFTTAFLPPVEADLNERRLAEDTLNFVPYEVSLKDTFYTSNYYGLVKEVVFNPTRPDYTPEPEDLALGLVIEFRSLYNDEVWTVRPMSVVRGRNLLTFSDDIKSLGLKVRLTKDIFDRILTSEDELNYEQYTLQVGESFEIGGRRVAFAGMNQDATHPQYTKQPGDISVGAELQIEGGYLAEPLFVVRDNVPLNVKHEVRELGLHFRFVNIDPKANAVGIMAAQGEQRETMVGIEIAENVRRSDFIILEAIIFPGINMFWAGTLLMLIGLGFSMVYRIRTRRLT